MESKLWIDRAIDACVGRVVRGDENVSRSSPALSNDEEKREREKFSDFMGKIRERRELSERESLDGQL